MSREFTFLRADGTMSKPVSLAVIMVKAGERIIRGEGPFVLSQDGEPLGPESGDQRAAVLDRLERRLKNGDVGPQYRVRNRNGQVVFRAREVEAFTLIDTNGNDRADLLWSMVKAEFERYSPRFAGAYVCKDVLGTATRSQHSYGNAVDIFFDTLAHQDEVAKWVVRNADKLKPYHVISKDRVWTKGVGWHAYTGEYHRHLHVDFDPQYSGACGVRG